MLQAQQKVMRKFQAYLQGADLQKPPSPETEPGVHGDHPQQTPGDQDLQAPAPSQQSEQSSRLQEIAEGLGAAIQVMNFQVELRTDLPLKLAHAVSILADKTFRLTGLTACLLDKNAWHGEHRQSITSAGVQNRRQSS